MRRRTLLTIAAAALPAAWLFGGCASIIPEIEFPLPLAGSLGTFQVEAGVPTRNAGTATFDTSGLTVQGGSLKINLISISVTAASAKTDVALTTAAGMLEIVVRIDNVNASATVCESGERYPETDGEYFVVTLDEDNIPLSVTPSEVTLRDNAVEALNAGQASICVEVTSSIDGSVSISSMTLGIQL